MRSFTRLDESTRRRNCTLLSARMVSTSARPFSSLVDTVVIDALSHMRAEDACGSASSRSSANPMKQRQEALYASTKRLAPDDDFRCPDDCRRAVVREVRGRVDWQRERRACAGCGAKSCARGGGAYGYVGAASHEIHVRRFAVHARPDRGVRGRSDRSLRAFPSEVGAALSRFGRQPPCSARPMSKARDRAYRRLRAFRSRAGAFSRPDRPAACRRSPRAPASVACAARCSSTQSRPCRRHT